MMPPPSPLPTTTPWTRAPPHSFQHTKLILGIIGVFLGAVAFLFLLTMLLHVCRRKKGTRRNTVNAETMTDHEMNYYVRFPISSPVRDWHITCIHPCNSIYILRHPLAQLIYSDIIHHLPSHHTYLKLVFFSVESVRACTGWETTSDWNVLDIDWLKVNSSRCDYAQ